MKKTVRKLGTFRFVETPLANYYELLGTRLSNYNESLGTCLPNYNESMAAAGVFQLDSGEKLCLQL